MSELIITKILGGIYLDSEDNNAIKINLQKIFFTLDSVGFIFDKKLFAEKLEKSISNLPAMPPTQNSKYIIAKGILKLAKKLQMTEEEANKIIASHLPGSPQEEIANHLQELQEFRKKNNIKK